MQKFIQILKCLLNSIYTHNLEKIWELKQLFSKAIVTANKDRLDHQNLYTNNSKTLWNGILDSVMKIFDCHQHESLNKKRKILPLAKKYVELKKRMRLLLATEIKIKTFP